MRVLLSGYYGFGNLGDEALLEAIVAGIRRRLSQAQVDVLSAKPDETAERYGVEATQRWEMRAVRRAITRADAVVSGGGGLLQSATSLRSLMYYAGIIREAGRTKRKTMIFAQSIGPLDRVGTMIVRRFCRAVDRATVRDERSRALLSSILPEVPVERTADPVFLYERPMGGADLERDGLKPDAEPYAIVSVRECKQFSANTGALASVADRLGARHGLRVAFLPLGGADDAAASTNVIRACTTAPVLLPEPDLARAAQIIAGARLVVGMRLHALILAASAGVPFLAVPYDPKVDALLEDLAYPLAPLRVMQASVPEQSRNQLVDEAVAGEARLRSHLLDRIAGVKRLAERNFDVLAELLEQA